MGLTCEKEKPILIIFQNGKPFSVITDQHKWYDVEYCKRDDCLYWHQSGAGGSDPKKLHEDGAGETWLATGYAVNPDTPGKNPIIKDRPEKYKKHPSEWEDFEENEAVYCQICNDFLPMEWGHNEICDHVYWDDLDGCWAGPGSE